MQNDLDIVLRELILNYYSFDKRLNKFIIQKRAVSIYLIQEMTFIVEELDKFGIEFEINLDDSISVLQ